MSTIYINIDSFNNTRWGLWDDYVKPNEAYLKIRKWNGSSIIEIQKKFTFEDNWMEKINAWVQEKRPFAVVSSGKDIVLEDPSDPLEDKKYKWESSSPSERQKIVEQLVLAKFRTYVPGNGATNTVNVDGLKDLIDVSVHVDVDTADLALPEPVVEPEPESSIPAMPKTVQCLKGFFSRQDTENEPDFLSCSARIECVWYALLGLICIVGLPLFTIYEGFTEDAWRNIGWRILDTSLLVLISPFLASCVLVQALAAAIIHPAIILRNL